MRHLAPEKFQEMIETGHETRNIEFKSSFAWSDDSSVWMREKVIQTMLGMANTRDGGTIIIGAPEQNGAPDLTVGMTAPHLSSFDRYDDIKAKVDRFGSNVSFSLADAEHAGRTFVVIGVQEFARMPVICKDTGTDHSKDGRGGFLLRKGEVYVRALVGPESTVRASDVEMAEIIEMAVDKSLRNLRGRGWRHEADGVDAFTAERGDF